MAVTNINSANAYMARSFAVAQKDMSEALARLGSQQRFQTASEDVTGYVRAAQLRGNQTLLDASYGSANTVKGTVDAADGWASAMIDALYELKAAIGDTEKVAALEANIAAAMAATVGGVAFNTANLTGTITMVDGSTSAMDIAPVGITGTSGSVDADIVLLETYVGSLDQYSTLADSVANLASTMGNNARAAEASIVAIDEAAEAAKYTAADIQQQAAVAIMSQANMSARAILQLF